MFLITSQVISIRKYAYFVTGTSNKKLEIAIPKRITELPDKLLMSGINLPGKLLFMLFYIL